MNPDELKNLATDARPRLSWRIGVSGHRDLSAADPVELNRALSQIFDDVAAGLAAVQKRPDAGMFFAPGDPLVSLVSPLAEGADRFCAGLAVRRGFELRTPVPFAIDEYKRDFPGSIDGFDSLLRHAKGGVVELDGRTEPGDPRNGAYMAVGDFVLRHCDLLIAIWDGEKARGLGGTALVVDRARQAGMPVVHIQSRDPHPVMIWEASAAVPSWQAYSPQRVAASIAAQIMQDATAPQKHDASKGAPLRAAEVYFLKEPVSDNGKEPDFLYDGPFAPRMPWLMRRLASIFPAFVKMLGKKIVVEGPKKAMPPAGTQEPVTRYLFLHHHRADALSTFYANVHRSAFLLVYALGAAALSCAVAALFVEGVTLPLIGIKAMYFFTGLELVVLAMLAALVVMDNNLRWRDRWLEYRLLAELLREADLLAQIGRPMPIAKIDELARDLPSRAWITIAYCAIVRRASLVTRKFDAPFLAQLRDYAAHTRLQDQIAYHERAKARNESIEKTLGVVGRLAFVGTIAAAVVKLLWHHMADAFALGLLAGVLPALAYACFGVRNQAEFEIVSRRSERMIAKLSRHKQRIQALDGDRLTSEALGREILQAAAVMRHDAADWTSIFEVKETETA